MAKIRIIFLGKDKPAVYKALEFAERLFEIDQVVISSNVAPIFRKVDYVISYLYPKKLKLPFLSLPCINFHSAPLPEYRGFAPYTFGILDGVKEWGVSAHFMDEHFDTGDIIKVRRFPIDPDAETAYSLEQKSQLEMLELFKEIMIAIAQGKELPRIKQPRDGRYNSKADFERLRMIVDSDTPEMVKRKMRAFYYPPHEGAYLSSL